MLEAEVEASNSCELLVQTSRNEGVLRSYNVDEIGIQG